MEFRRRQQSPPRAPPSLHPQMTLQATGQRVDDWKRLWASALSLCLMLLLPSSCGASVSYLLARTEDTVNAVCLGMGADPNFAETGGSGTDGDRVQVQWLVGPSITTAKFMYIGNFPSLNSYFCASSMHTLLYNPTLPTHFLSLDGAPLPGPPGYTAYVVPIWQARPSTRVDLTIVNSVNATWQIISSFADDPVIGANSEVQAQVPGSFFNDSLGTMDMVQEFLSLAALDPDTYPYGQTMAAIILDETTGQTAYLFFGVFDGNSNICILNGGGLSCVQAHIFEAQYNVSAVDFAQYNDYYAPRSAARRRLLAQDGPSLGGFVRRRSLVAAKSKASGSASMSGALGSLSCKQLTVKPAGCKPGSKTYPRCTCVCMTE